MPWFYVMILWLSYSFKLRPYTVFFKEPCDIKSVKMSTAYDGMFSRHRHSNLMITTDFARVLVFVNSVWAVYIYMYNEPWSR